ncbi:MAG: EF-P lysine aminoacylase GenX [Gammaproteobacteria bacterium]|nr:EF-P lysine aminoacylase GenX [Gammaproteobacteria bacterium]NNF50153.1 EF-P lysine aminoacylase GenX [Woeseiaceae bacterium]MBT8093460.1 EF-P lysine aminoacylase GenX [Gammaproteobacteria bacterium]MBT8105120.1 EF-P lysine aminoacylase GenX [Gammaproteobacteria bacterium]NNK25134.1 EF-P lysine aminoacylase GenX [Woeseiaceae bacterium]
MTNWRPSAGPRAALSRANLMRRIRGHFDAAGMLEVDTPALSPYAVSDLQIESFAIAASAVSRRPLYLHTSPEYCMKRLLAAGFPDIYSICRVFRDSESGRQHQPEFTMIEWYRLGMGLGEIIEDTLTLLDAALGDASPVGAPIIIDYADTMQQICGIDVHDADTAALADAAGADAALRAAIGDAPDDWLDLLLATRVLTTFAPDRLTVLRHYPASQAALARLCPSDPRLADRFEVFSGPVELANGYVELTDAREQAERIGHDNDVRERRGRARRPVDQNLLDALATGLPQCAGVAMGLERLQMVHDNTDDIRDVITFAFDA